MLHTGKKPFAHDSRDVRYADIRPSGMPALPALPQSWGRGMDFTNWLMLGNGPQDDNSIDPSWAAAEGAGDCTMADPGHSVMMNAYDSGNVVPVISGLTAIKQYADLSNRADPGKGYDPQTGENDDGLEIRNVLDYRLKEGYLDDNGNRHQIGIYVLIEVGDWASLREACWLFPGLSVGMTITQAQMDQFNNNQVWSYVPNSQSLGGHDVILVGRPAPGLWTVVTWARRQVITAQCLGRQADEIWAYLTPERYSTVTGLTYNGYKDVDMEKYITMVGKSVT